MLGINVIVRRNYFVFVAFHLEIAAANRGSFPQAPKAC